MAPIQVVAFDLDDTLIELSQEFVPRYLALLTSYLAANLPGQNGLAAALEEATQVLMAKPGGGERLDELFYREMRLRLQVEREGLEPLFREFFESEFHRLQALSRPIYGALGMLAQLKRAGYRLALLTSALFPAYAIDQRLAWAGLEGVAWDWRTAFETVHATKPQPDFYREAAEALGIEPNSWLMVGNDLEEDIVPAYRAGMHVYWVHDRAVLPEEAARLPAGTPVDIVQRVPRYLEAFPRG
ncbi:MAG: HAD family hydrolase [Firmicutes bacterium]|nr:HAD family hydrolase [Bacillota bacterium]